jgi:phosphoheptose isomerase
MTSLWRPDLLKDEARDEAYEDFDKNIRPLSKKSDGTIDITAFGLENNDVDAFRHAHVSGVFTIVYSESTADIFGRLNENSPFSWYSNSKNPESLNMDL